MKAGNRNINNSPPMIAACRRPALAEAAGGRAYSGRVCLVRESAMIKLLVVLLLFGIVGSLFSGLFYLYRDRGSGERTVRALTLRIGLSISLFLLLLGGFRFGLIPGYTQ
jgi:hypothetical protein